MIHLHQQFGAANPLRSGADPCPSIGTEIAMPARGRTAPGGTASRVRSFRFRKRRTRVMSEIVELVGTMTQVGWKLLYVLAVVALGFYCVTRGRKAAAVEQAEESRDRRAA